MDVIVLCCNNIASYVWLNYCLTGNKSIQLVECIYLVNSICELMLFRRCYAQWILIEWVVNWCAFVSTSDTMPVTRMYNCVLYSAVLCHVLSRDFAKGDQQQSFQPPEVTSPEAIVNTWHFTQVTDAGLLSTDANSISSLVRITDGLWYVEQPVHT